MSLLSSSVNIIPAVEVTEELYLACQRLIPQLTSSNPPPSWYELSLMLIEGKSILFMAQDQGPGGIEIISLATLMLYRVPTGMRAVIEDVVVDEQSRGRGVGKALTRACLERTEQEGCPQVMLTSNPRRQAANQMYQRMGFELSQTNVYRYNLKREK